jgi:hypothetical protein
MSVPERAGSRFLPFKAYTFCNHQTVNRRRRLLTIFVCGLVALFTAVMISSRRKDSVPIAAIEALNAALLQDGYADDKSVTSIDELALPPIPGVKAIVGTFYPDYRKQRVNRSYSKDGAKLGIDYTVRGAVAADVSLPADAEHCARARKMARELSALNPNLAIWLRTNDPPIATKR